MKTTLPVSSHGSAMTMILVVLWIASHLDAFGQGRSVAGVTDLPLHSNSPEELKALNGPQQLIKGEYVIWNYPFAWSITSATGKRIGITKGNGVRFIGRIDGGYLVESLGVEYTVLTPPNTVEASLFYLAPVGIIGLSADLVGNRIGQPNKLIKTEKGTGCLWSKTITRSRETFDEKSSTTTGTIGSEFLTATTTTRTPRIETLTYNPYSFVIYFNAEGKVDQIDDLVDGTPTWKRK